MQSNSLVRLRQDGRGVHASLSEPTFRIPPDYAIIERTPIQQIVSVYLCVFPTRRKGKGANGGVVGSEKE